MAVVDLAVATVITASMVVMVVVMVVLDHGIDPLHLSQIFSGKKYSDAS